MGERYYGGGIKFTDLNWDGFVANTCCDELMFYNNNFCCEKYRENFGRCDNQANILRIMMFCANYHSNGNCLIESIKKNEEEKTNKEKAEIEEIIQQFEQQIQSNSNDTANYMLRGLMFSSKKYYDLAIDDFTKILNINPKDDGAYVLRSGMYFEKKEYDKTLDDCNAAIRINPYNAQAYICRSTVYFYKKFYDKTVADIEKAIRIDPTTAEWTKRPLEEARKMLAEQENI